MLGNLGIKVVHEHAQSAFLLPPQGVQFGSARRRNRAGLVLGRRNLVHVVFSLRLIRGILGTWPTDTSSMGRFRRHLDAMWITKVLYVV